MSKYQTPSFKTEVKQGMNAITLIENKFLQGLVDLGAMVVHLGDFTVFGYNSMALFKVIDDNTILLECISTPADERQKGSGTSLMQAFIQVANETNTAIELFACNVTGNGFMMAQQMVIAVGTNKKNKLPVAKLKGWYQKLGFTAMSHDTKAKGWNMKYTPETK